MPPPTPYAATTYTTHTRQYGVHTETTKGPDLSPCCSETRCPIVGSNFHHSFACSNAPPHDHTPKGAPCAYTYARV